jgi:hypothetical protein
MSLNLTLGLIAGVLLLTVFAGWRGARPSQPHQGVRMIPWRFVMLLSAAFLVLLLVHAAALLGMPQRTP